MLDTNSYSLPADGDTAHLRVPLLAATGTHAGPRLVVTGPEALVRPLAECFWTLPGLDLGSLVIRSDDQDPAYDLPDAVLQLDAGLSVAQARFVVLERMASLRLIAGVGAPARRVA